MISTTVKAMKARFPMLSSNTWETWLKLSKRKTVNQKRIQAANNPIKALLFDAGDILYFRPNRGEALKQFLLENGLKPNREGDAVRTEIKLRGYRGDITRDAYFT